MAKPPKSNAGWGLSDALELIREMQPQVRHDLDYHICLGGGVLNRGLSEKDLDLFFIPLNGFESRPNDVMLWLGSYFNCPLTPLRDGPDYAAGTPWHQSILVAGTYLRKRIDFFIQ